MKNNSNGKMRAFGSLGTATLVALLFLSLAQCMPNKDLNKADYPDDGEYDEDSTVGNEDDDASQSVDAEPSGPIHVRSRNSTLTVRPGDNVEFPCDADNVGDTVISWLRNNELLYINSKPNIKDSRFSLGFNASLRLQNVTDQDGTYQYRCQILVDPPIVITHKLHVVDKPRELVNVIQAKPGNRVDVNENESVTFSCETNMDPKPEIIWSHKGERLHASELVEVRGNSVTIKKATRHHGGGYQCLAENGSDRPPHGAIEVFVRYTPKIEVEHEIVHTGKGIKSQLTCIVHAHPHAKLTWHKNAKLVTEKKGRRSFVNEKSHHSLIIEHTAENDLGHYTCTAKNQIGESSKIIELTGAPSKPRFHGGKVADDDSSLILQWHVESYAPITEYKLEYRRKDEMEWKVASPRVTNGKGNQFMVEHSLERLLPGSYEAKLMARNEYGWSPYSSTHTFREEYRAGEAADVKGSASTTRPLLAFTALLVLLASSYESNCL